jgi:hypothetical protein
MECDARARPPDRSGPATEGVIRQKRRGEGRSVLLPATRLDIRELEVACRVGEPPSPASAAQGGPDAGPEGARLSRAETAPRRRPYDPT